MSASGNAPPGGPSSSDTDFAAMWSSDGMTRTFSSTTAGLPADLPFLFQGAQRFGPYLIVRPLGKGGMGQVYEAEEIDNGRRVAIKILSRGLGDDEERERFLSEGRLAAALSHPNSVYIFGTCEVQGLPVIAMELAPGGTLKDLLVDGQPLAAPAAVDAILQVIAGLEGAAALGILHRDIKPSNCFVDRDGRILVGDFGLSIATLTREAGSSAHDRTIVGTPGFASPEQLRGEPLDVRSDIYSVGATIYYLLTGRPPFADESVTALMTRVATEIPASPAAIRRDVPKGLAAIVMQCLARMPAERFADYRALAAALEPFRSTTLVPARLPRRFLAGVMDYVVSALSLAPINTYFGTELIASGDPASMALLAVPSLVVILLYYAVLEGRLGAAAGKAMLGLRVVGREGTSPGFRRGLLRAAIFLLPGHLLFQGLNYAFARSAATTPPTPTSTALILGVGGFAISLACLVTLFSTARRRNGYAALHDLGSRTRVVVRRRVVESRQTAEALTIDRDASPDGSTRIGPYVVHEPADGQTEPIAVPKIVEGYDDRLRRKVWIELKPPDTAALPPLRRDLGRPARARWLAGRRTAYECWDAFEAIPGQPLTRAIARPQSWSRVRHWLSDLTHEIVQGLDDGSLPTLDIDLVWVGADGRVRLLDWPAPGAGAQATATEPVSSPDLATSGRFLCRVAVIALRGGPVTPVDDGATLSSTPLPLSARHLLLSLRDGRAESADALRSAVDGSLRSSAVVPRSTRAIQLALCAALPVFLPVLALAGVAMNQRLPEMDPQLFALKSCLDRLVTLDRRVAASGATTALVTEREAIETYVAGRLRGTVANPATWTRQVPRFNSDRRNLAARALAAHPNPSAEQLQKADDAVARLLRDQQQQLEKLGTPRIRWSLIVISMSIAWIAVAVFGLIGAVAARGGVTFRIFGTALVTRNGAPVSRLRALLRALVAWAPAAALFGILRLGPSLSAANPRDTVFHIVAIAMLILGGVWAVRRPARGIQDHVAGTWLVPR